MQKIALVTGGAGFIGSHMVDLLLKKNYKVRVIDNFLGGREENLSDHKKNRNLILENFDIRNSEKYISFFKDVSYFYHFAGIGDIVPSIENPVEYFSVNVQGTVVLMEMIRHLKKINKLVYAASSSCYGVAETPTNEEHPINPLYPYALSKFQGEMIVKHYSKVYNIPINIIRIFNAYGPKVRTTGAYGAVFGVFFKQKLSGAPLTVVGDGNQKRDFVYVTDVVTAFYLAAKTKIKNEIWNLGGGNPITINYLVNLIKCKSVEYLPKRPSEPDCTWADISKIKKDLNWRPEITFKEGVNNMLNEIEKWKDAPLWNREKIDKATKIWFKYLGK